MGEKVFDGVIWKNFSSFKMTKKEMIDPLEELEAKWDLEMTNFPSLQPSHFRLSLEFLEKVKSFLQPEEWKMFWFDRDDERKFEISAEELVEEWRGSEASFVGV